MSKQKPGRFDIRRRPGSERACPRCDGHGFVALTGRYGKTKRCSRCKGTGKA